MTLPDMIKKLVVVRDDLSRNADKRIENAFAVREIDDIISELRAICKAAVEALEKVQ